jgi:imidazoleglycerol phosphate synthase glutamine amidotransferase subunit HisH
MELNNLENHLILEQRLQQTDIPKNKFYFAHSYCVKPLYEESILAHTIYDKKIPVVINYKNIYGVQFHPEKSFLQGQKILKNFIDLC